MFPHKRNEIEINGVTWEITSEGLIITGILRPLILIHIVNFFNHPSFWYLNPMTKQPINMTKPIESVTVSEDVGFSNPIIPMILDSKIYENKVKKYGVIFSNSGPRISTTKPRIYEVYICIAKTYPLGA